MNRVLRFAISAAAAAAALWAYASQPRRAAFVPIVDGRTIDFSSGAPVVSQTAADKAEMDQAVKDMDAAAKDVTFPSTAPARK
ncbi:MAG TPA: hypothetical protein VGG37_06690 [Opitutaceae bacterium]|jgi:hypothetical protein